MIHQDWKHVVWKKNTEINKKSVQNPAGTSKFRALDSDSPPKPEKVSQHVRIAIQKARQSKKMTQKELAKVLNVSLNIITDYESGKAIPDKKLISKMNKIFGVKIN